MEQTIAQIPDWLINPLLTGFLLDLILGDPRWLPHPIRWFGKLILFGESKLNKGNHRLLKGVILVITLTALVSGILISIVVLLNDYPRVQFAFESIMVFYGIANRSLITESYKVERTLKNYGVKAAQKQLSYIVGRDTDKLSENQIRTATLETLSENLSDGVITPIFYYAIGGIPFMFVYKLVNTCDSMIGYKNERFLLFGKVAARFDDVLNFIPARLTAFLMVTVALSWRGFLFILKYGHNHSSPNAGYPEAALAGILNCRFGGNNQYNGELVVKPYIGHTVKKLSHIDLLKACVVNFLVALLFVLSIVNIYPGFRG
jgi:adenosylcobinamide-phosphate synthase